MEEKLKYSYLIFLVLLIFIRCSHETPYSNPIEPDPQDPPPDTIFYSVQGTLICENEPLQDAQIILNNTTSYSDSTGYFYLDSLVSGRYNLTINRGLLYEQFSTTFFVDSNLTFDLEINRRAYDYFPMRVGNKWMYFWVSGGYVQTEPGVYESWVTNGSVEWEIILKYEGEPYKFKFLETYHDSTNDTIITNYFDVRQVEKDNIKFLSSTHGSFRYQIIQRYNPVNTPERIEFGECQNIFDQDCFTYQKNVGLIERRYQYGGGNQYGFWDDLDLLEFIPN
jgi:hypothetical protein